MNIPYVMKKCSKCGSWLVASTYNFHKKKNNKYGLYSQCKSCVADNNKQRYEANKEEIIKKNRAKYKSKKRDIPKYKVCSSCGNILLNTTDNFYKVTKGHSSKCKKCAAISSKQWYDSHKEQRAEHDKIYYQEHKERKKEISKIWYQNNREKARERQRQWRKQWRQTSQGQIAKFNEHNKRRLKEEQQGTGLTKDQWLEMMNYFDWRCAYSGEKLAKGTRSIDHIESLDAGGDNMVWNMVPMKINYNSSKQEKEMVWWYKQQSFFSEARLAKIYEWQEYAYNKWGKNTEYFNTNDIQISLI